MSDGARCHYCRKVPCICDEARPPVTPQADHERLSPNEWEAIARHLEQHDLSRTAERVRAAADQLERQEELRKEAEAQPCVLVPRDQLERNAEVLAGLREALIELRAAVKSEPVMNHMKYDALGVKVNKALEKAL